MYTKLPLRIQSWNKAPTEGDEVREPATYLHLQSVDFIRLQFPPLAAYAVQMYEENRDEELYDLIMAMVVDYEGEWH